MNNSSNKTPNWLNNRPAGTLPQNFPPPPQTTIAECGSFRAQAHCRKGLTRRMTHRRGPARGPLSPGPSIPEEEKLRRLVVQLPDSTHRRFKQLAAE